MREQHHSSGEYEGSVFMFSESRHNEVLVVSRIRMVSSYMSFA